MANWRAFRFAVASSAVTAIVKSSASLLNAVTLSSALDPSGHVTSVIPTALKIRLTWTAVYAVAPLPQPTATTGNARAAANRTRTNTGAGYPGGASPRRDPRGDTQLAGAGVRNVPRRAGREWWFMP